MARDPYEMLRQFGVPVPTKPVLPPTKQLPDPPRSMPGWCVTLPLTDNEGEDLHSAIVVEMDWAETVTSDSYAYSVPFGVGDRILFYRDPVRVDGYHLVAISCVIAWTPAP